MWEDINNQREPEIDYLNGEIVKLAKEVDVPTPINESIIALIKKAFIKRQSPALSGDELLTLLRLN